MFSFSSVLDQRSTVKVSRTSTDFTVRWPTSVKPEVTEVIFIQWAAEAVALFNDNYLS